MSAAQHGQERSRELCNGIDGGEESWGLTPSTAGARGTDSQGAG